MIVQKYKRQYRVGDVVWLSVYSLTSYRGLSPDTISAVATSMRGSFSILMVRVMGLGQKRGIRFQLHFYSRGPKSSTVCNISSKLSKTGKGFSQAFITGADLSHKHLT